jgi:8-oxo-dGTP pyrophosphatase MutT (NUDIX family)
MKATKISIDNAKKDKLFYFLANAIIYREADERCLILKRSATEKVHPNKYCVPGGKLEWNDFDINNPTRMNGDVYDYEEALENLLKREVLEESGIEIHDKFYYINSVGYIRPDEMPVMMQKFTVKYKSGEVKIEEGAFTDYAWINKEEILSFDCIDGIKEEVIKAISLYKNL